jgi:hypothetical protein
MADETQSPTPSEPQAATPATQEPAQAEGTAQNTGGDAGKGQGAPTEEGFTRLDPNTLPPEVRGAYDNMLRDYKTKTAQLAEERKSFDPVREKAASYDRLVQEIRTRQAAASGQRTGMPSPEEWQEAQFDPIKQQALFDRMLDAKVEPLRQQQKRTEALSFVEQFSSAKDEKGQALRPDFGLLSNIGEGENALDLINVFYMQNPAISDDPTAWNVALNDAYTRAKAWYDNIASKVKADVLAAAKKKASGSSETPSISAGSVYTGPDPKKITDREAVAMAMKGIRVPQ